MKHTLSVEKHERRDIVAVVVRSGEWSSATAFAEPGSSVLNAIVIVLPQTIPHYTETILCCRQSSLCYSQSGLPNTLSFLQYFQLALTGAHRLFITPGRRFTLLGPFAITPNRFFITSIASSVAPSEWVWSWEGSPSADGILG